MTQPRNPSGHLDDERLAAFLDGGLRRQVELDLETFTRSTGRRLSGPERERFVDVQLRATRWTFIGSGMTHENFLGTLGELDPVARARVERMAVGYC